VRFLLGLDPAFVMPGGVAVRSIDRFLGPDDEVVVLHLGLSSADLDLLARCASNASFRSVDCGGMLHPAWIPPPNVSDAAFLRYLAPDLLDVDRCVYVDADVIVRRDPAPLEAIDLTNASVAAVRSRVAAFAASIGGVRAWRELGIPSTNPYFNSGVLVMNLARWREHGVTARLTEFLVGYGAHTWYADQEALNAVLWDDWVQLDRSWNYVTYVADSFIQQPELEPVDPYIAHFAGARKPWVQGPPPIFADDWFELLADTPWRDWQPEVITPARGLRPSARRAARRVARRVAAYVREEQGS
jgi:lipopolysaccharide biosynthesis glycosyltransferase